MSFCAIQAPQVWGIVPQKRVAEAPGGVHRDSAERQSQQQPNDCLQTRSADITCPVPLQLTRLYRSFRNHHQRRCRKLRHRIAKLSQLVRRDEPPTWCGSDGRRTRQRRPVQCTASSAAVASPGRPARRPATQAGGGAVPARGATNRCSAVPARPARTMLAPRLRRGGRTRDPAGARRGWGGGGWGGGRGGGGGWRAAAPGASCRFGARAFEGQRRRGVGADLPLPLLFPLSARQYSLLKA